MDQFDQHALRPGAERRVEALRRRFSALSAACGQRLYSKRALWRRLHFWLAPALCGALLGAGALAFADLSEKFGSVSLAARHVASAPNCDAARALGLAPAHRSEPGYYPQHDADNDGIACELWIER